jgi:hypothetical protein
MINQQNSNNVNQMAKVQHYNYHSHPYHHPQHFNGGTNNTNTPNQQPVPHHHPYTHNGPGAWNTVNPSNTNNTPNQQVSITIPNMTTFQTQPNIMIPPLNQMTFTGFNNATTTNNPSTPSSAGLPIYYSSVLPSTSTNQFSNYQTQNYPSTNVYPVPNFILPPVVQPPYNTATTNNNMLQQMMALNQNGQTYQGLQQQGYLQQPMQQAPNPTQSKPFHSKTNSCDDTIVIVDDDDDDDEEVQIVDDSVMLGQNGIGFQQTGGRIMSTRKISREESERPVYKLSMHLLKTYKHINNVYYAEKRKREQLLQQQQQQHQQQLQLLQQRQQQQFLLQQQQQFLQQQQQQLQQQQQQQQHHQIVPYPQQVFNEGYDDENGNYIAQINEELDSRYLVQEMMGKGSFGVVVKAFDRVSQEQVAVKIIKNKQQFYNQAKIEIQILQDLNSKDKYNKYNVGKSSYFAFFLTLLVQFKQHFQWRNHLCIVFELLSYNLYDLLKYTSFRGVSLNLIRKFAQQLLYTLHFLSRPEVNIIHCDLKVCFYTHNNNIL